MVEFYFVPSFSYYKSNRTSKFEAGKNKKKKKKNAGKINPSMIFSIRVLETQTHFCFSTNPRKMELSTALQGMVVVGKSTITQATHEWPAPFRERYAKRSSFFEIHSLVHKYKQQGNCKGLRVRKVECLAQTHDGARISDAAVSQSTIENWNRVGGENQVQKWMIRLTAGLNGAYRCCEHRCVNFYYTASKFLSCTWFCFAPIMRHKEFPDWKRR